MGPPAVTPRPERLEKRYHGISRREAELNYAYDAARMSRAGYLPVSKRWRRPGTVHVSCGFPWWTTRRPGTLTIVWRRSTLAEAGQGPVDVAVIPEDTETPDRRRSWLPRPMRDLIQAYERHFGRAIVRVGSGCLMPSVGLMATALVAGACGTRRLPRARDVGVDHDGCR